MTRRELLLAIVAGSAATMLAAAFIYVQYDSAVTTRLAQAGELEKKIADQRIEIRAGETAARKMEQYRRRSLPAGPSQGTAARPSAEGRPSNSPAGHALARSLYQTWLLAQAEQARLEDVSVVTAAARTQGGQYKYLVQGFTLTGRGDLGQLTRLLYAFYSNDVLHRAARLYVKPISDSRQLEITVAIEALILPGAVERDDLPGDLSPRMAGKSLEDYAGPILQRNLFGPANRPPQLARIGSQTVRTDRGLSLTVKGTDADKLDKLTYRLGDGAPEGARIDPKSGELRWQPKTPGTYSLTVHAADDGLPSKSASESFTVSVVDPPPPSSPPMASRAPENPIPRRLEFDPARHAYVTAILEVGGQRQIWLHVRTTGEVKKFAEGDRVEIGSIAAVVHRIGVQDAELAAVGKRLHLVIGQSLTEATAIAAEPAAQGP